MTAPRTDARPLSSGERRVRARRSLQATALALTVALSGCSSDDIDDLDVLGMFDEEPPPPQTAGEEQVRERGEAESAAAQDQDTPSLTSVPSRPDSGSASVRERVVEGLVADRENARYTDEAIRLQGSGRPAEAPRQAPAPERAAPPEPAPEPAGAPPPPPEPPIADSAMPGRPTTDGSMPDEPMTGNGRGADSISQPPPSSSIAATSPSRESPPPPAPRAPSTDGTQSRPGSASSMSTGAVTVDPSAIDGGGYSQRPFASGDQEQVATIQFAHGSARLDARDRQILQAVAQAQRESGEAVLVVGHASSRTQQLDKSRHEVANFQMSLARANAVARALVEAGVAAEMVRVEATADNSPIYAEAMPTGEAGNRRAEIYFIR